MLKLEVPDGTDLTAASTVYTNRWGNTSLTRLQKAVAWIGDVVPGITGARLLFRKNQSPDGLADLTHAQVEFTAGNLTSTHDAIVLTNMASTLRIELLNAFAEGAGANIYVPAPIFKD